MIHFLVPEPLAPSGGNRYDHEVAVRLGAREVRVPGNWPCPESVARARFSQELAALPDEASVLLDGLLACGVPEIVLPQANRLRLAVLVHLPLAEETGRGGAVELNRAERATLHGVAQVLTTSEPAAARLRARHGLDRVEVAEPGVDPAPLAHGTNGRDRLLCVASMTERKGHERLIRALAEFDEQEWPGCCFCVGPSDPEWLAKLRELVARHGLGERIRFTGALDGDALAEQYAAADLFVLASRAETFGMAVSEALAHGIPAVATRTGAIPRLLGPAGLLVSGEQFAPALRRWFSEPRLRAELRDAARAGRTALSSWEETARRIAEVLR